MRLHKHGLNAFYCLFWLCWVVKLNCWTFGSVLTILGLGDICSVLIARSGVVGMICIYCILFENYMFWVRWSFNLKSFHYEADAKPNTFYLSACVSGSWEMVLTTSWWCKCLLDAREGYSDWWCVLHIGDNDNYWSFSNTWP